MTEGEIWVSDVKHRGCTSSGERRFDLARFFSDVDEGGMIQKMPSLRALITRRGRESQKAGALETLPPMPTS